MTTESDPMSAVFFIVALIFTLIVFLVVLKLIEEFLPPLSRELDRMIPKVKSEIQNLFPKFWALVKYPVDQKPSVVKQEIHHHYVPQYDQSKKNNISDSVIYQKVVPEPVPAPSISRDAPAVDPANHHHHPSPPSPSPDHHSTVNKPLPPHPPPPHQMTCGYCRNPIQASWNVCPFCTKPIEKGQYRQ